MHVFFAYALLLLQNKLKNKKKTAVGCLRTQLLEQAWGLHSKVIKDGAGAVIK